MAIWLAGKERIRLIHFRSPTSVIVDDRLDSIKL